MTSKLKCPFCNGELVGTIGHPICRNQDCVMCDDPMPQDLLEELVCTRKALEIARTALKDARIFASTHCIASAVKTIDKALEQIEHKE